MPTVSEFAKVPAHVAEDGVIRVPVKRVLIATDVFLLSVESHEKVSLSETRGSGPLILGYAQKGKVVPGQTELLFQNVPPGNWFVYVQKIAVTL